MALPTFGWYPIFRAEYYSLTSRFRSSRRVLPFLLSGGVVFLLMLVFLLLEESVRLLEVSGGSTDDLVGDFKLVFLTLLFVSFVSFFLPISLPMSRLTGEGGSLDPLLDTPVRPQDFFVGVFLAEYVLINPVLAGLGTGSVIVMTRVTTGFASEWFMLGIPLLAFVLFSVNTALGLWMGLFLSRFLGRSSTRVQVRSALTVATAVLSLTLLLLVDRVTTAGVEATLTDLWVWLLPPTYGVVVLAGLFGSGIPSLQAMMLPATAGLLLVVVVVILATLLWLHRWGTLEPAETAWVIRLTVSPESRTRLPFYFRVMLWRFFRDPENIARLVLATVFTVVVLYLMGAFFDPQTLAGANLPSATLGQVVEVLYNSLTFLSLVAAASTILFLEASYFSVDSREFLPLLLGIPEAIPRYVTAKWGQTILVGAPLAVVASVGAELSGKLPFSFVETVVVIFVALVGLSGILLGLFVLNPAADEQDVTILVNAVVFFSFVFVFDFAFLGLSLATLSWDVSPFFFMVVVGLGIIVVGAIFLWAGVYNLSHFDLGEDQGPLTRPIQALGKGVGMLVLTWVVPLLLLVVTLLFTLNLALAILAYYLFIAAVIILPSSQEWWRRFREGLRLSYGLRALGGGVLVASLLLLMALSISPLLPSVGADQRVGATVDSFLSQPLVLALVLGVLLVGALVEELFFRGWLYEQFESSGMPRWVAVGLTALFFGLVHAPLHLISFGWTLVMGLVLTCTYSREKNLLLVSFGHFLYNVTLVLLLLLGVSG